MKPNKQKQSLPFWVRCLGLAAIATGGFFLEIQPTLADVVGPDASYCLSPALGGKKANCTANDTRLAGVKLDANGDPIVSPADCTDGQFFDLTATFLVATNASIRYDLAVGFSADGDPNGDGALTGSCTRSTVPSIGPIPPAQNLDGDACGDVTSAISPVDLVVTDLPVLCVDTDGDGYVNLPYYVSWAQNEQTVCNNAGQALPGTTSKCEINNTFNIPVRVETPTGAASKDATVDVTYSVGVTNSSTELTLTLSSLTDSAYNNITTTGHDGIISTSCTLATIHPNTTYPCTFVVRFADPGNPGSTTPVDDVVTAEGTASNSQPFSFTSNSKRVVVFVGDTP